ncbi:MAG TPA: GNAT family N-acetyltransferase [Rhizomicrobium sp.]|jgi:ribosomal protein S18 acetylase RimI-like enzyme
MNEWLITRAAGPTDLADVEALFRDYADGLSVDLAYQDFAGELASLPGAYAPPRGAILIARVDDRAVGCVAMRPMSQPGACEMKRLHVREATRGTGLGRALAEAIIDTARAAGYRCLRLDTLPDMQAAQALYRALGFEPIPAYYDTPVSGTLFMEKAL